MGANESKEPEKKYCKVQTSWLPEDAVFFAKLKNEVQQKVSIKAAKVLEKMPRLDFGHPPACFQDKGTVEIKRVRTKAGLHYHGEVDSASGIYNGRGVLIDPSKFV